MPSTIMTPVTLHPRVYHFHLRNRIGLTMCVSPCNAKGLTDPETIYAVGLAVSGKDSVGSRKSGVAVALSRCTKVWQSVQDLIPAELFAEAKYGIVSTEHSGRFLIKDSATVDKVVEFLRSYELGYGPATVKKVYNLAWTDLTVFYAKELDKDKRRPKKNLVLRKSTTVERAISILNRALALDPVAVGTLFKTKIPCSPEFTKNKNLLCGEKAKKPEGEPEAVISPLHLINSVFGLDEQGNGPIVMLMEPVNGGKVMGFVPRTWKTYDSFSVKVSSEESK